MLYQPIVCAVTGMVVGAEALMRWPQPRGRPIDPEEFLKAAETGGVIGELSCFAIRTVSTQFGGFLRAHRDFRVSINIVASDLYDPSFHEALYTHIEDQDIQPTQIALELRERGAPQLEGASLAIRHLRRTGYKVYLDCFDTAGADLAGLCGQSFDAIKLGPNPAETVRPLIDMARAAGINIIVKGVETNEQAALARDRGAWAMQGWLLGKPEPAIDIMRRVAAMPDTAPHVHSGTPLPPLA